MKKRSVRDTMMGDGTFPRHPSMQMATSPLNNPTPSMQPYRPTSPPQQQIMNDNDFFNSDDAFGVFEQPSVQEPSPHVSQPLMQQQQQQSFMMGSQQQQQKGGGWLSFLTGGGNQSESQQQQQPQQPQSYEPVVDDVPLLEELGINFKDIYSKSVFVLNPLSKYRRLASQRSKQLSNEQRSGDQDYLQHILDDMDLAGPLLFCLLLGFVLLLRGKIHFGYIYGVGAIGCLSMYFLLNLMCPPQRHIEMQHTISILGYCLLPMVFLGLLTTFLPLWMDVGVYGVVSFIFTNTAIVWSTWSAASMLVGALGMYQQKALVAYPVFLVYVTFALLTVF